MFIYVYLVIYFWEEFIICITQMKRLAVARRQVIDANRKLQDLNNDLCLSNAKLKVESH